MAGQRLEQALEHPSDAGVVVAGGDLVGEREDVGMRVGHGDAVTGPDRSIGRSLGMSPNAITSARWIPRSAHRPASAEALLTPAALISSRLSAELEWLSSAR